MSLFIKTVGTGKPLILLHGWGFNHNIWNDLAAQLATEYCVYLVDLPGHGNSPMSEYKLELLAKQLAAELPSNAIWIGWSLGGLLAMAVARWHPNSVQALILVATSPKFVSGKDWNNAMSVKVLNQFAEQLTNDIATTLRRFLALQITERQQLRHLQTLLQTNKLPQTAPLQAGLKLLQDTDLRTELSKITCPSLLCLGGKDKIVPVAVGADCQTWWQDLEIAIIKPAAHIPFLSHSEIFISILTKFLTNLSNHNS
jgi:pimeloyl-[acyl-carrier protein] methyl ester esterase